VSYVADAANHKRTRVDDLRGPELAGEHGPGAEPHLAVRQGWPILYHEHASARDALGAISHHGRGGLHDARIGVRYTHVTSKLLRGGEIGRVHLVDDDDVRHAQVGLTRVVRQLVSQPQRIGDDDMKRGPVERQVIVASVPHNDVCIA
jgi:hypothetical protein